MDHNPYCIRLYNRKVKNEDRALLSLAYSALSIIDSILLPQA